MLDEIVENEGQAENAGEDWENTESEIIEEVRKFAKKASAHDSKFYERVRSDRAFEAGEQWGKSDEQNRGKDRAQMTINLCSVFVNAVVNPFAAKPFKIKAIPRDQAFNDATIQLNAKLTELQNEFMTHESNVQGLHDAVVSGIGFTYATVDDSDGERRVRYLHVDDPTTVIVDPDAKGVSLEESDRIAVVDFIPYETAKERFGEDVVKWGKPESAALADIGDAWEIPKDDVAVITYFRRDGHDVEYFRLCGDKVVDYGVYEGLDYLPVFAFTGDRIWLGNKRTFSGIIRKIKAEQQTVNYAQSQLIERLAKSPKGFFLTPERAIEGFEEDYQNAEYGNSYILRFNDRDDNRENISPPVFTQPSVKTDDLQSTINAAINQMSVATGISPNGIVEQNLTDQKTATEVLLRTKSSQSNVSNYINHAKETIRIAGTVLARLCTVLYGIDLPKGSYDIVVEEGCVSLTKMEEDREKLLALSQIVPDSFKPLISQQIVAKLDIEGGKQLSEALYNMLPQELRGGQPSWQEFQAQQIQMQQLQMQLQQMAEQNKALNDQLTQAQLRTRSDLIMEDKRFAHEVQLKQLDAAIDEKGTAQKMLLEAEKDRHREQVAMERQAAEARERTVEKIAGKLVDGAAREKNAALPPFSVQGL